MNNENSIDMNTSTDNGKKEADLKFGEYSNSMSMMSMQSLNYDRKPIDDFKHPKACVNLIQQMLDRNANSRIGVEDILSHEWCKRNHNKTNVNIIQKGKHIIENLKNFKGSTNWWSLALYRFFVHQIVTEVDKEEIEEVFKYLDEDYGGELDQNELEKGLRKIDPSISSKSKNFSYKKRNKSDKSSAIWIPMKLEILIIMNLWQGLWTPGLFSQKKIWINALTSLILIKVDLFQLTNFWIFLN